MTERTPQEGELILYRTADDAVRIEVLYESETFWLSQRRIAELFGVDVRTISEHLRNGKTAAELIAERAHAEKPSMGLTAWKNAPDGKILKSDVSIAKNYLIEREIKELERIVTSSACARTASSRATSRPR